MTLEGADEEGLLVNPEDDTDRCERCGGRLIEAKVTGVCYVCSECGAEFDHHLNPLRIRYGVPRHGGA